jgi:hypothetical protein
MKFVHDDAEFDGLIRIVAQARRIAPGLVEKDYWVTHCLWSLHRAGFDVWFKGGTSLSKGFGLIERFSEDLDLKVEPGSVRNLPSVSSWKSEGTPATRERKAYFEKLPRLLPVVGADVMLDDAEDSTWRSANLRVAYAGRHLADLGVMKPYVLLEIGSARVTPFVLRDMSSFVHDHLVQERMVDQYEDNRPKAVRCVHPLVTLLEKLDALHRRFPKDHIDPASFVRHFEDAARIIDAEGTLAAMTDYTDLRALAKEMLASKQLASMPSAMDGAWSPAESPRWTATRAAYAAIAPMFWGNRIALDLACQKIRTRVQNL